VDITADMIDIGLQGPHKQQVAGNFCQGRTIEWQYGLAPLKAPGQVAGDLGEYPFNAEKIRRGFSEYQA
jgi:hypothetical protein